MSDDQRRIDEGLQEIKEVWECQRLIGEVADYLVRHHHLWRIGDNNGGAVRLWIEHEFDKRGLVEAAPSARYKRRTMSASRRVEVFERDGFACVRCGSRTTLTVDHIHPVSEGGTDDDENLQTLCRRCNMSKGVKSLSEWQG